MKKFKNFIYKYGGIFCAFALFVAMHSANTTCIWKFYQPEEPIELAKFKKL